MLYLLVFMPFLPFVLCIVSFHFGASIVMSLSDLQMYDPRHQIVLFYINPTMH